MGGKKRGKKIKIPYADQDSETFARARPLKRSRPTTDRVLLPRGRGTLRQAKPRPEVSENQAEMPRRPPAGHHAPAAFRGRGRARPSSEKKNVRTACILSEVRASSHRHRSSIFYCSITDLTIHHYCSRSSSSSPERSTNTLLTTHKLIARAISSFCRFANLSARLVKRITESTLRFFFHFCFCCGSEVSIRFSDCTSIC